MIEHAMSTAEAIRHTFENCTSRIASSRAILRRDLMDCGAVHDLRVSTRTARAALALFKSYLDDEMRKSSNRQLRELAKLFRESREWNVLKTETLPTACNRLTGDRQAHTQLYTNLEMCVTNYQEDAHHKAAKVELGIPVFEFRHDIVLLTATKPIADVAPDLLSHQAKVVKRRLRHLGNPDDRHDARKAIKRLRYSIEFLSELFPAERISDYLKECKRLHNILGELTDLHVATVLLNKKHMPQLPAMQNWIDHRTDRLLSRLDHAVKKFRKTDPFWLQA